MSKLSYEEQRLISIGRELDLKRTLKNWKIFRDAKYDEFKRMAGASDEMLKEVDSDLKFINDKIISVAVKYEQILDYNRKRGWS